MQILSKSIDIQDLHSSKGFNGTRVKHITRFPFLHGESLSGWTPDLIKQAICGLSHSKSDLSLRSMGTNRTPQPDVFLSAFIGKPTSRKLLHFVACRTFGSWKSALLACSIEVPRSSYNKFWNKTKITGSIQLLRQRGHPLTVKSIWRDRKRTTSKVLLETTGKLTTGSSLHDAARRYFGSWDVALKKSGINPEDIKEKPFWTKKKIVKSILSLQKAGIPLHASGLGGDYSRRTKEIIKDQIGKGRVGRSLYMGASTRFGSWDRALREAGINPVNIRQRDFFWNKRSIGRILRILHDSKIPINSSSFARDRTPETTSVIFDCTGQHSSGSSLYRLGNQKCGSWDATLKFSGLWLSEVRRTGNPCENNASFLVKIIRLFNRNQVAMNPSAILSNSNQLKFLLEQHIGSVISGASVMDAARNVFGSWDKALWEAGFDPNAIRLKSRPYTSQLPIINTHVENIQVDGERRNVVFFGAGPQSPEDVLHEREDRSQLDVAVSKFNSSDQKLIDRVFDAILQIHHYKNQEQLIEFIVDHLDGEISHSKVKSILKNLATTLQHH